MTIGEYIRELRLRKGLTLRGFCRELGVDPSNWSRVERGQARPPQNLETGIKSILGVLKGTHLEDSFNIKWAKELLPQHLKKYVTSEKRALTKRVRNAYSERNERLCNKLRSTQKISSVLWSPTKEKK